METEHLHRLIDGKKWTLLLSEIDNAIARKDNFEMDEIVLSTFEKIDKDFREQNAQRFYFDLWKIAYRSGKIKLAKNYAEFILGYLVEFKRVPALKQLITELSTCGLLRGNQKFHLLDLIQGKKNKISLEDPHPFELHPEMWKESSVALKHYLITEPKWEIDQWKLIYEFILKFHFDEEIFLMLAEKTIELKKKGHKKKFFDYLHSRKVSTKSLESQKVEVVSKTEVHADYDQVAMDILSGAVEPNLAEQKRIIVSINTLSAEELLQKGKDMVVAFGLLGMDQVVVRISERLVPLLQETKDRVSVSFMLAQALFNSNEYYKAIDLVDDIFDVEPLIHDELVAFDYIKAECFLKLKHYQMAKKIFLKIRKQNPHYRLVKERLRTLEEIK